MNYSDINTPDRIFAITTLRHVCRDGDDMDDGTLHDLLQHDLSPQNLIAEMDSVTEPWADIDKQITTIADLVDEAVELLEELADFSKAEHDDGIEALLMLRLEQITDLWITTFCQDPSLAA